LKQLKLEDMIVKKEEEVIDPKTDFEELRK
jgi:hypothetical protein